MSYHNSQTPNWLPTNRQNKVRAFHIQGDIPVLDKPQVPPDERVRLRAKVIMEEAFETVMAMYGNSQTLGNIKEQVQDYLSQGPVQVDLPEVADGLTDLDYVVEGTRLEFGIDGDPLFETVHAANMRKFGPGSWKRDDGKQMKPPDWQPPDIAQALVNQGWDPDEH